MMRRMAESLPKFDAPPVVETVLGIQFAPLPGFSTAHAGCYWKKHLDPAWTGVKDAPRLPDQFERLGTEQRWRSGVEIRQIQAGEPNRVQFVGSDGERMIQVQDSRFIYNWRKREGAYPSYDKLRPEFDGRFNVFRRFVQEAELGSLEWNQWEVTYVNHIPRGELWQAIGDWPAVFPDISFAARKVDGLECDQVRSEWQFTIGQHQGRLHASIRLGKTAEGMEVAVFQLTARGPIDQNAGFDSGFSLGHAAIVRSFTEMTSPMAHEKWKRTV